MDNIIIEKDNRIDSEEISFLCISNLFFPLDKEMIFINANANVLVFIPPPVEAGDAPIHIKKIVKKIVIGVKAFIFNT